MLVYRVSKTKYVVAAEAPSAVAEVEHVQAVALPSPWPLTTELVVEFTGSCEIRVKRTFEGEFEMGCHTTGRVMFYPTTKIFRSFMRQLLTYLRESREWIRVDNWQNTEESVPLAVFWACVVETAPSLLSLLLNSDDVRVLKAHDFVLRPRIVFFHLLGEDTHTIKFDDFIKGDNVITSTYINNHRNPYMFNTHLALRSRWYPANEGADDMAKRELDTDAVLAFLGWHRNRRFGADGLVVHRVWSILIERVG